MALDNMMDKGVAYEKHQASCKPLEITPHIYLYTRKMDIRLQYIYIYIYIYMRPTLLLHFCFFICLFSFTYPPLQVYITINAITKGLGYAPLRSI